MGDVDGPNSDKLDERMWGDEEEEEEEDGEKKDREKDEEFGDGMDEEESRMVAKEENQGDAEGDDREQNKEKKDSPEEPPDPNNLEPKDESEFNDDEIDPRQANNPPEAPVPDDLDLPDDLDMDKDEKMEEGEENQQEANPLDIEEERFDEAPNEGEDNQGDDGEGKDEEKMETGEKDGEEEGGNQEEPVAMETNEEHPEDQDGDEDGRGEDKKGFEDKEEGDENEEDENEDKDEGIDYAPDQSHDTDQPPVGAETMARSKASKDMVQAPDDEDQSKEQEQNKEEAGKSGEDPEEDKHKSGTAESRQDQKGHEGSATSEVMTQEQSAREESKQSKKPSQSDSKRSLGSTQERYNKRLKTVDPNEEMERRDEGKEKENETQKSDLYEHLADSESHHDAQTMDAATEDQMKEKESVPMAGEEGDEELEDGDEEKMKMDEEKREEDPVVSNELPSQTLTATSDSSKLEAHLTDLTTDTKEDDHVPQDEEAEEDAMETEAAGEKLTESTIHTVMEHLGQGGGATSMVMDPEEVEKLRREMEEQLALMNRHGDGEDEEAEKMWQSCESVTSSLARDLCEQLRLVLEPTQASKLRGDFRTGKRLNMRKVIPYIASGFRKDKIWLRRTKPSKRQYQIMLAVDDSSSMADNRSKRLAFESLAVISNALTWLEAGQLAVCSFGESVKLLHPFHEQFSDQSGSSILRQFTFAQKKTKIAQLLKYASASMLTARSMRSPGGASAGHPETSQLLVIVSDGRGLFLEGMETVKNAVRAARDANIFLMFVVIDNPENKDSILDIRVPIFKQAGAMPEIQSYMEHFPFPFYIILRNINALPETLSDALRQWFELVTAADKS